MPKLVTLITGTSKGIGRFLAEWYVKAGHEVIGCSRHAEDFQMEHYTHFVTDISNEEEVVTLFKQIKTKYGKLDHLINNAGVAAMNHSLLTPAKIADRILNINVKGTFLFCREAAKVMLQCKMGRIVNFGTVATPLKLAGEAIYAASKAAVVSLTEILAHELGDYNITVNAICPTLIETDLVRAVPLEKLTELIERQAIKRFGKFSEVANVIDFFLQPASNFVTAQTIYLGGISK